MQVVVQTTEHLFSVGATGCARPPLRHLDLETNISYFLDRIDLQVFTQLESLRLRSWSSWKGPIDEIDLDISSLCSLRRLQIENWSPKSIKVTPRCRVYAMWQPALHKKATGHEWLDSPCWRATGTKLASLHVEDHCLDWQDAIQLSAIQAILECQDEVETLSVIAEHLGSPDTLLNILFPYFKGMKTPLRVDLSTTAGCHLRLDDALCLSKTLVLNIEGSVLVPVQNALGKTVSLSLEGYSTSAEAGPSHIREQLARDLRLSRYNIYQIS